MLLNGTTNKLFCLIHKVVTVKIAVFHGKYGSKYRHNSKVKAKQDEFIFLFKVNSVSLIKIKGPSKSYSSRVNL